MNSSIQNPIRLKHGGQRLPNTVPGSHPCPTTKSIRSTPIKPFKPCQLSSASGDVIPHLTPRSLSAVKQPVEARCHFLCVSSHDPISMNVGQKLGEFYSSFYQSIFRYSPTGIRH